MLQYSWVNRLSKIKWLFFLALHGFRVLAQLLFHWVFIFYSHWTLYVLWCISLLKKCTSLPFQQFVLLSPDFSLLLHRNLQFYEQIMFLQFLFFELFQVSRYHLPQWPFILYAQVLLLARLQVQNLIYLLYSFLQSINNLMGQSL